MRIVFIGASAFGLKCLRAASTIAGCEVVGALTAPRKFSISYRPEGVENVLHADISSCCRSLNIPCLLMENGMNDLQLFDELSRLQPDAFLVAGWYHMLPRTWREMAPAYGLHASLLPDYSGGAPLVWAIINGESKTGITLFKFADGVDNGPIVGQSETPVADDDTIATLYERIERLGVQLITEHLPRLAAGSAELKVQDESKRRFFPQRSPEDGMINWTKSNQEIHNFIRAQTKPYPGAFTFWKGEKLTIWKSRIINNHAESASAPGEVLDDRNGLLIRTGMGTVEVLLLRYKDNEASGSEFRRTLPLENAVLSNRLHGASGQ